MQVQQEDPDRWLPSQWVRRGLLPGTLGQTQAEAFEAGMRVDNTAEQVQAVVEADSEEKVVLQYPV